MISIFSRFDHIDVGTITNSKMRYVKDRLEHELKDTIEYYRYRNGKVKNSNMLVRLITTASPDYNKDIFDFMRILDSTAIYHSKTFDIASKLDKGSIVESNIFGKNSLELFIYKEKDIDVMSLDDNWRDLKPIEVVKYDGTDTSLVMPSDKVDFDFPTLSIFKIDVRMLMVQYRYWALERISNDFSTDPANFIYNTVFPNMISDILDLSIINRLMTMEAEEDIIPNNNRHPFNILDINKHLDRALLEIHEHFKDQDKLYTNLMKTVPLIGHESMYDMLFDTDLGNRQNKWALFLSKLPYIKYLMDMSGKKTFRRNKQIINEIKILIRVIERDRILEHIDNMLIETEASIDLDILKQTLEEI